MCGGETNKRERKARASRVFWERACFKGGWGVYSATLMSPRSANPGAHSANGSAAAGLSIRVLTMAKIKWPGHTSSCLVSTMTYTSDRLFAWGPGMMIWALIASPRPVGKWSKMQIDRATWPVLRHLAWWVG